MRAQSVSSNSEKSRFPITQVYYDIIGRLSVANINRMDVCKDTRKEAELYYLRKYVLLLISTVMDIHERQKQP